MIMNSKVLMLKCLAVVMIIGVIFLFIPQIANARPLVIKVSHQWSTDDVRDKMARVFGEKISEKTNGSIKFRYYPAQSLFKSKEQWDALRKGALDMSIFPLDYASGKVPQLSITLMPCSVTNITQGLTWRNKPIGRKINSIMEDNGVKNLVWAWFDGGMASSKKQIKLPEDVDGLKMRAAGKRFEFMLQEAGASITSMPSSELYHAMATGVLDSCLTSSASYVSYKLFEQVKHINAPRDFSTWFMAENLCMSMKTWEKLSHEQQKIFSETAEWMHQNWIIPNFSTLVENMIQAYANAGVDIHYMNQSEFDQWLAFAKKTAWKDFAKNVEGGRELLELAEKAMK